MEVGIEHLGANKLHSLWRYSLFHLAPSCANHSWPFLDWNPSRTRATNSVTRVLFSFPLTPDFSCWQDGAGVGEGKPGADFLAQCRQGLSCQGLRLVACNDDDDVNHHDHHVDHRDNDDDDNGECGQGLSCHGLRLSWSWRWENFCVTMKINDGEDDGSVAEWRRVVSHHGLGFHLKCHHCLHSYHYFEWW